MKTGLTFTLAATLSLAMGACGTTQPEPKSVEQLLAEKGYTIGEPTERIQQFRFTGWNYLDREHVIVSVTATRNYLVTLRVNCNGLFGAEVIAFSNTGSYLTRFDTLLVRDQSRILERCPIESMNELVKQDAQAGS